MRCSRLLSVLLPATLLLWAIATQHRVGRLQAELDELRPALAEIAAGHRGAAAALERRVDVLAADAERTRVELDGAITRTKEIVDAYASEMRASDESALGRVEGAHAELATLRRRVAPDAETLHERLLAPTVHLSGLETVGSGTLIWSGHGPRSGTEESYVLTAHHVVRKILAEVRGVEDGVTVTVYVASGKVVVQGDLVAHSERIDAALLKLRTTQRWPSVARVLGRPQAGLVRVSDPIYAAGCPLGNDPILTRGEISALTNLIRGENYWMLTAPTWFGNSGGGIYLADTLQLVGVFSKIYTTRQAAVVSHMGLCTPIAAVHEWLADAGLAFVLQQAPVTAPAGALMLEARLDPPGGQHANVLPSIR
jgi:S1-C subfamily serine protease